MEHYYSFKMNRIDVGKDNVILNDELHITSSALLVNAFEQQLNKAPHT